MNKHIWYRLEYKRAVDTGFRILVGVGCIVIALGLGTTHVKPDSLLFDILIGSSFLGCFLMVACVVIINTLMEVDKHEWELTKIIKGGTK